LAFESLERRRDDRRRPVACAAFAQATPPLSTCAERPDVPACDAVPGDRAEGWGGQPRRGDGRQILSLTTGNA
jgi:hypothetical protein